jgi:DNA polymerase III subunit epsilon
MALPLQTSFDDLSTPLFDVTFCVLDLETTGGSARSCEITEIGAVRYRHGEVVGTFQTLVDPGTSIPPSITLLTGITHAMVVDAPRIETALPDFIEFIGNAVIVGHNVRFDMSFLNAAADRLDYPRFPNQTVDTAALARRLVRGEVRNLKLRSLAAHFRSPVTPNHRALADAQATGHVFHSLLERAGSLGVTNIDDLIALPRARGSSYYRKISLSDSLPRSPGVYFFKDRHGTVIYVGKATNLRQRVRQYFYGDTRRTIGNMMRELHSIEHQACSTLIEAEVAELRLIHAHKPRYNKRSRPPKTSHYVRLTAEEFPRLSVVRTLRDDAIAHIGPFRSKRTADQVVLAIWDAVPIRRCRGRSGARNGKCAGAQLGVALCPCDGTLDSREYDSVVRKLVDGLDRDPSILLAPLRSRMEKVSREQRFEEAGWFRDRHNALARALERRQRWKAIQESGIFEVATGSGDRFVVDHGVLVASWRDDSTMPLRPAVVSETPHLEAAPSVEVAEEADLIWKWLDQKAARLEEASGNLALPLRRPERLETGGRAD